METTEREREPEVESDVTLLHPKYKRRGIAERMWKMRRLRLTENYNYISRNILLKALYILVDLFVMPFIYIFLRSTLRFRIEGKEHLKAVRRRAAVTVSNHVHDLDALMVTRPFWPRTPYIVARAHNLEVVFVGAFNRIMRAVPLPSDMRNFSYFTSAMNRLLSTTHNRLHIFPEGEIQPHSGTLRRFGNGAFHFAVTNSVPIVPMVFVFPTKHTVRLLVGRPIELGEVPDFASLTKPRQVKALAAHTKDVMQKMLDAYYEGRPYDPRISSAINPGGGES